MSEAWLCILDSPSWDIVRRTRLWAAPDKPHEFDIISQVAVGDALYFYCKQPESAIVGVAEVASRVFTTQEWEPWKTRFYPHRVKIKPAKTRRTFKLTEPVPFALFVGKLTAVRSRFNLMGHAMLHLPEQDVDCLRGLLNETPK